MRKLVTLRRIAQVRDIPGADAIECIRVDGWDVVAKKGEFIEGDLCMYFEIDSFLPANDKRFAFLAKTGVKTAEDGVQRIRLRTAKLRGQISQGLALRVSEFPEVQNPEFGVDYSATLNVTKYERPEPKSCEAAGKFPEWIRKTDEERVQNCYEQYCKEFKDVAFVPTLKLDGSSITMAYVPPGAESYIDLSKPDSYLGNADEGYFIVCSRNLQLKFDPKSHFWISALRHDWLGFLRELSRQREGHPAVIQGELVGPGIQGNHEKFGKFQVFAFNAWDVKTQSYYDFLELRALAWEYDRELPVVPILGGPDHVFKRSLEEILKMAEGPSINNSVREGIVWKSCDSAAPCVSFKSISNKFLLKGGD